MALHLRKTINLISFSLLVSAVTAQTPSIPAQLDALYTVHPTTSAIVWKIFVLNIRRDIQPEWKRILIKECH
jgi:hypothetical protein